MAVLARLPYLREAALWPLRQLAWLADVALDNVPCYEDGRWYRYGDWGCRLRLARLWWPDEDVRGRLSR
jgi:hypothetical protein